jgi:hypothetical protein
MFNRGWCSADGRYGAGDYKTPRGKEMAFNASDNPNLLGCTWLQRGQSDWLECRCTRGIKLLHFTWPRFGIKMLL